MDDQINVLGGMAEDSPEVRYSSSERTGSAVMSLGTVGDRSCCRFPYHESGGFRNPVGKVPIRSVTSEAFLWYKQIVDGENQSGKEVTNFHPICDGSNLVHEAMNFKSGVTPPAASAASAPSNFSFTPPFPKISA